MKLVLDTNVLVAGLRSNKGASRRILALLPNGTLKLLLSVPLLLEYEAVLKRPHHLEASGLSEQDVDVILDMIAASANEIRLHYLWRPMLRDPSDDMVAEVAVAGNAEALVTLNERDFGPLTENFGIAVLNPGALIALLEKENKE